MCIYSVISELGRTARMYSELASRTEPTVSDVHSALIDSGSDIPYLQRHHNNYKRHVSTSVIFEILKEAPFGNGINFFRR